MDLGAKGEAADILVMTATPIPRSLTLASYGDMDLSVARREAARPQPGRHRASCPPAALPEVVEHLRRAIAEGRQAYWVCPLVAESRDRRA